MHTPSRRHVLLSASALTAAAALSACRSTEGGSSDTSSSGSANASGGGAFPVTIAHKYGSTTISAAPKRVVVVGLVEQDMLLALGVVPVGVSAWLDAADNEIYPWARPKLGSAKPPTVIPQNDGIPVEKVAALKPDLIIGQYAGITKAEYDRLSKIAPTVAQPKQYLDYGVPWDVNALNVAKAVGKEAEGKKIVDGVRRQLADAKAANPEFSGKTGVVATSYEGIYVYGQQDPRSRLLTSLGFVLPEKFKNAGGTKEFGASYSAERAKELDVDTVVWIASEAEIKKLTGNLWSQTKAAKQGRSVYIPYVTKKGELAADYSSAFNFLTPLSIPYLLKSLVPQLKAAVDGNPATKVPGPRR